MKLDELRKQYDEKRKLATFQPVGVDIPWSEIVKEYTERRKTEINNVILNDIAERFNISYFKVQNHLIWWTNTFIKQTKVERREKAQKRREELGPIERELKDALNIAITKELDYWYLDLRALTVYNMSKLLRAIQKKLKN